MRLLWGRVEEAEAVCTACLVPEEAGLFAQAAPLLTLFDAV